MKMLRLEPFKYDSYKALRRIYMDSHQYDKTWCLCNTLAFLKKADPDELQFYEQYKPRGLVKAKAMMTNDSWGKLVHGDENRYISAIFAAVWQGVAAMKAYPHKELGIKRKDRRQLRGDPLMFSKLFYYVGQVLNVPLPEVFLLEDNKQADIQLANFMDRQELCPSFIVRPHLLQGKTEREIAFLSAKKLTFMRPEYYLKMLLPTNTELKVALLSAIALINRQFPIPADVLPMVQQYAGEVAKRIPPQMYEHLAPVVNQFLQERARGQPGPAGATPSTRPATAPGSWCAATSRSRPAWCRGSRSSWAARRSRRRSRSWSSSASRRTTSRCAPRWA